MKVCFFGIYDPGYARNRVLQLGFERLGHAVVHCRVDPRAHRGARKYFALWREYRKIRAERFDLVIVCFPGQSVVWLARMLFGRRIIFDAFLSLYDSNVFDRALYGKNDPRAWKDWLLDKTGCMLARKVLLDTNAHIDYFAEQFGVARGKMVRVWIGADDSVFYPRNAPLEATFTVNFHGNFIPLQGVSTIIAAADALNNEDIDFRIIGSGQEFALIEKDVAKRSLARVHLLGRKPVSDISGYIASAHVSLGIFGDTEKTSRVIPNKVYEALAMGKACITADTGALRELADADDMVCAIPAANPQALADAIMRIKQNPEYRRILERSARAAYESALRPQILVENLLKSLR